VFFFEKKNQKTFICRGTRKLVNIASGRTAKAQKFLLLFFKKEVLPCLCCTAPSRRVYLFGFSSVPDSNSEGRYASPQPARVSQEKLNAMAFRAVAFETLFSIVPQPVPARASLA